MIDLLDRVSFKHPTRNRYSVGVVVAKDSFGNYYVQPKVSLPDDPPFVRVDPNLHIVHKMELHY